MMHDTYEPRTRVNPGLDLTLIAQYFYNGTPTGD